LELLGRPIIKARPYAARRAHSSTRSVQRANRSSSRAAASVVPRLGRDEGLCRGKARIPFYTTPQGRGVSPTTPFLPTMRNDAFRQADLIIILGTRTNMSSATPLFRRARRRGPHPDRPRGLGTSGAQRRHPVVGDCRSVLQQFRGRCDARTTERAEPWQPELADGRRQSAPAPAAATRPTATSIRCGSARRSRTSCSARRPLVDGQEVCSSRQSIPPFVPDTGNSGPFGTMGVGLPFAVGARPPSPRRRSSVCTATAFGQNAVELDTAVSTIALAARHQPQRRLDRRPRAISPAATRAARYDKIADLGC
jgi:thiamine pyrophosphate-dependent acetolactate synthase large subunit-like protein